MASKSKKCPAGHNTPCTGRGMNCVSPERAAEIVADARSGENWAAGHSRGPACVCGAFLEGSTVTSWGVTVQKGECQRHGVTRGSRHEVKRLSQQEIAALASIRGGYTAEVEED